ncbi:uncharacterized protein LOC134536615 [Bacillus rossius redtenbacheri]|uniref:uncharacterized protein LOC134536615 n=1 Tax=Bacillus rossius redtenbacheri TaxID=93214 RepID=UPI002FDCFFA5
MNKFHVVQFEDGLQVVPGIWLQEGELCYWPDTESQTKLMKAICNAEPPSPEWLSLNILRIFGESDTYENAVHKLKLCERFSDVESGPDSLNKRKKRQMRAKRVPETEDSETELEEETSQSLLPPLPKCPNSFRPQCASTQKEWMSTKFRSNEPTMKQTSGVNNSVGSASPMEVTVQRKEAGVSTEFEKLVLKKLNIITYKLESLEEKLRNLESAKLTTVCEQPSERIPSNMFPLASLTAVEELELLLQNPSYFDSVVFYLKTLGGVNITDVTFSVMKKILSNEVAMEYSYFGFKGKKTFKNLKLSEVVISVVRCHVRDATEKAVGDRVAAWLKHARTRLSRSIQKSRLHDTSAACSK